MNGTSEAEPPINRTEALRIPPFLVKVLVTATIGAGGYALTNIAGQPEVWRLTISVFLGGAALISQYMIDFERRLGSLENRLVLHNTEMKELVYQGFARVNQVTDLFGRLDSSTLRSDEVSELLSRAIQAGSGAPPIVQAFIAKQIADLSSLMEALARQLVDYDGEDYEWIVALTQCATHTIDATSTPVDRDFWPTELGQRYLRAQRDAVDRGVHIRRLFIVRTPEENGPELEQLCHDQQSLGIEVRVLVLAGLSPIVRMDATDDFLVFDSAMSYELGADLRDVNTRAMMDWRPDRVARRAQRFRALWEAAE